MLSNTGGNDRDNSSNGAVFVGDPKCADETEVSVGVSVLSEAPANCTRLDENENAAAAKVPTMAESIITYNPNLSSPAFKFASAANEFDEVEASCDELVSGGSGPVCCEAQDTGPGGMVYVPSVGDGTVFGVTPPDKTKGYAGGYPEIYYAVILQEMQRFLLLCPMLCQRFLLLHQTLCRWLVSLITVVLAIM